MIKNNNTKTIGKIIKYLGLYLVSFVLLSFAISKFFNVQFQIWNITDYTPLQYVSNMNLAWAFFGRSYNYNLFIGVIEFLAGVFILFDKSRLIGLLMAFGIYVNVIIIDYEFGVTNALYHALIEFVIIVILLTSYLKDLKKFFWDMAGKFSGMEPNPSAFIRYILPVAFILLVSVFAVVGLNMAGALTQDKTLGAFEVSEFSVNNEPLKLGQGIDTKAPMMFFEFNNRCILSANDSLYNANYLINGDSIFITFDKSFNGYKTLNTKRNKDESMINGVTDKGETFYIKIRRIARKVY